MIVDKAITHPSLGAVTLRRSTRARRIALTIRGSGEILLTIPQRANVEEGMSFLDTKVDWINAAKERIAKRKAEQRPAPIIDNEKFKDLCIKAEAYLPDRIREISEQTNLKFGRLTLRATRSKWGSCSGDNNISLSIFLMLLPKHLIDFVIVHELCHTIHHNHSPQFHALVDRVVGGNEKALIRELKTHSTR